MNINILNKEDIKYGCTAHNRTVYAAGAEAPLAPFGRCRSLALWLAFPPGGGHGRERRNMESKRQPRAHTLRRLVAASGTSYTTGTLSAIVLGQFKEWDLK